VREKPPARKRKQVFMTTTTGQVRLAPTALDAATSARVISVVILFLVVLATVELTTNETFYVYHPAVLGNERVSSAEVIAASQLEGLHVLWLQPERVVASLRANLPELRAAFVWCSLPAECTIQVEERRPAFEWRQGQTRTWIDAEGMVFPARGQSPGLPVVGVAPNVTSLLPGQLADSGLVSAMLALAGALPEVRSYRFTAEHGIEFNDPKGNWPVYLGVGPDVAARVAMWKSLSASLASRNVKPKFVDVHYANAPFYSK
jgi:hypothetical protein